MAVTALFLLLAAAVFTLAPPAGLPRWVPPVAAAAVAVGIGLIDPAAAGLAMVPLIEPIAFLLAAVPMALMLDRVGFFEAAAAAFSGGHRLRRSLWALAAAVTTVFNLDASVVLLTPLYVRIAQRHGLDPLRTALQPVLLASLASSALPVSNLTNLIVASRFDLTTFDFLTNLALPSLAAVVVGWMVFWRTTLAGVSPVYSHDPIDRQALRTGIPVVVFLLAGFTLGELWGAHAWMVVVAADVYLAFRLRTLDHIQLPWDAALLVSGLAVVAAAATPFLPLESLFAGVGPVQAVGTVAVTAAGANLINNLPALLVGLEAMPPDPDPALWALLIGVNFGPVLVLSGSLAGLLWLSTVRRLGLHITALQYSRVGVTVGLPAMAAAIAVWLLQEWLKGTW